MTLLHYNETPSFTKSWNAVFVHLFPLLSILIFFSLLSLSLTPVSDWRDYHGLCCCHWHHHRRHYNFPCHYHLGPDDPTTATFTKTSLKNRLRILKFFAIILSRPGTEKKGIYVGAEERGPPQSSDRDAIIYSLPFPFSCERKIGHFTS